MRRRTETPPSFTPPETSRFRGRFAFTLFLALALTLLVSPLSLPAGPAQGKQKADERKKPSKPELETRSPEEKQDRQKGFRIGVNVDLVVVHSSVHDKNGNFVAGLK